MLCPTSNSHSCWDQSIYALRIPTFASGLTMTLIPNTRHYQIIEGRKIIICKVRSGYLLSTSAITGLA
jgi:hypothetical protein